MRPQLFKFVFYSTSLDLLLIIIVISALAWSGSRTIHTYQSTIGLLGELQSRNADESEVVALLGNTHALPKYALTIALAENEHGHSWAFCEDSLNSMQSQTITAVFNMENKLIRYQVCGFTIADDDVWHYRWHRLLRRIGIE